MIGIILTGVFVVIVAVVVIFGLYPAYITGLQFKADVATNFYTADRSSEPSVKYAYFTKFVKALEDNGLTKGQTTVLNQREDTSLENLYNVTKSLEKRMANAMKQNDSSYTYSQNVAQINSEMCWFPINIIEKGYMIQKGIWFVAIFPTEEVDRCYTPPPSN